MTDPPSASRPRHPVAWFGVYVLLGLLVLLGPLWSCPGCDGKGSVSLIDRTTASEVAWLKYRCTQCWGLGRVGALRRFAATADDRGSR
ncbi:MAG: hypothetical protein JO332_11780 [Planctomycetaceae bacterium]|nr:hypothetical protein [Planctomycetaceae bacterium]